ncbi:MAG: BMP family ABC transporter substrate-binding protein [Lachnospiraceae bacterium]|nr:BMP family ABC transporter substrate-binding protein [Lachnospiraceae bacterium]MBQ6994832.1 BMP family ABC transporter substrate-binding protein [Lachnospiraceae bacterium]
MKKKVLSLMLASAMVMSLVACGSAETPAEEKGKIALVTDVGTIDDESFNQASWEGVVQYGDANGIEYTYYQPIEDSTEERINQIDLAVSEGASVIVLPGYLFGETLSEVQATYPDVRFIALDVSKGDMTAPIEANAYACTFSEEQAGYLAGYAAVKDGYTKLGFLGGMAVPAVIRYGYGYIQGIDAAAQELGVDVEVKYTYGGQFQGDASITAKMDSWYSEGTEIVFACGGGIYTSALEAALNYNGMIIGVDVDQYSVGEGKAYNPVLTSAMKGLTATVVDKLDTFYKGEWDTIGGQIQNLGLADGDYLGLPTDGDSWAFKTYTKDDYNAQLKSIKDGSITISNDTENQPTVSEKTTVNYID